MQLSEFARRKGPSVLWFCSRHFFFFFLVLDEKTECWTKRVLSLSVVPLLPVYLSAVGGSTPCQFSIDSDFWWCVMMMGDDASSVFDVFSPLIFLVWRLSRISKNHSLVFPLFSPVNCSVVATQVCFCLRRLVECEWVVRKNEGEAVKKHWDTFIYSWKDASETSSTDLSPNHHGAEELGLKRRCYSYDAGNSTQRTKKGSKPVGCLSYYVRWSSWLGLFGCHFHVVMGMDAVIQGYEGKYMNENDFLLYLNVEIKTFLLLFKINKMLLLTSACDFSLCEHFMWTLPFLFSQKKGFYILLRLLNDFDIFICVLVS